MYCVVASPTSILLVEQYRIFGLLSHPHKQTDICELLGEQIRDDDYLRNR